MRPLFLKIILVIVIKVIKIIIQKYNNFYI